MFWRFNVVTIISILLFANQPVCCQLSEGVSVVLHQTNITRLTARALHAAGYHLHIIEHLSIMGAPKLEHVVVEDLIRMPRLKSFFITQAPLLHRVAPLPALPELRTFMITTSGLLEVPNLSHVHDSRKANTSLSYLQAIDLEGNHIKTIPSHALRVRADQVSLNYNLIEEVPKHAFKNAQISKLSFKGNTKLKRLDEHAFAGNLLLRQLDLSNTAITSLPTKGLEKLQILRIERTPSLKYIPSIYEFQQLEKAYLTHHFHCCAFKFPEIHNPARHKLYETQMAMMMQRCASIQKSQARKRRSLEPIRPVTDGAQTVTALEDDDASTMTASEEYENFEEYFSDSGSYEDGDQGEFHDIVNDTVVSISADCGNFNTRNRNVECTPASDALNPCEDVMGWSWLRASVWVVVAAAVVGNVAVLLVLLTNHTELTVPRFLMCNLAFSDLCTGLYLLMLAVVDLRSYGEFFNYAYNWQYGVGCKIAGFLSVFSGQLSVITLTIVTLERWFAITYAIYLERRISLSTAAKIMLGGWLFSSLMAGLPLLGVSDYSSTSICLPVESKDIGVVIYQGSLFLTNALAWVTIVVCYVQIYRSLGGGGENYGGRRAAAAAERRIANKMALLIGTDLLCWAPVAFFGVTALAGVPLVDVSHGKVLLVFFYPLNACANPFLYAILTKQYRRDFITLVARTGQCNWLVEKYKLSTTPPPTAHTNPSTPAQLMPLVDQKNHSQISKEFSDFKA
ncbi:leucine-rich repeat G protein-coupled receptor precursor [Bombyx mori]|uniref:Leucine-rich repeat G protein-coupled receptor n=1 Tax=Bombyx mori TaxID=7091 RepID=Q86S10_BOMMO|nr:leucine-rich repeat G protein-coupled receptor precursor [Bombyx mori]AAO32632.1 leucine-rich repeat G protein-coupled receptor [Bombyx mori]